MKFHKLGGLTIEIDCFIVWRSEVQNQGVDKAMFPFIKEKDYLGTDIFTLLDQL